jgi:acetoin utilization deacetylase AcuC-like enzyme
MSHYVMESMISLSIPFSNPSVPHLRTEDQADEQVMQHIIDWYRPGAIVLQMGADSLAGDKLGGFNLTLDGKLAAFLHTLKLTN